MASNRRCASSSSWWASSPRGSATTRGSSRTSSSIRARPGPPRTRCSRRPPSVTGLADDLTKELERQLPAAAEGSARRARPRPPRCATRGSSAAFADTSRSIRQAILSDGSGTETFTRRRRRADGGAARRARARSIRSSRRRSSALPPLEVRLESSNLPHVHDPRSAIERRRAARRSPPRSCWSPRRCSCEHDRRSIALVGRRTAYLAATPLVVFVVLPRVLSLSSGDAPQIASALLRVYGDRVLPSAIALVDRRRRGRRRRRSCGGATHDPAGAPLGSASAGAHDVAAPSRSRPTETTMTESTSRLIPASARPAWSGARARPAASDHPNRAPAGSARAR